MVPLITGGICLLLIIAGFAMAIAGLCGISKHGSRGILGKGIAGLLINGLLLIFFISGFASGFGKATKSRELVRDLKDTVQEMQADAKNSFNPETGITNLDLNHIDRLRNQFENGSKNLSGDDALVFKAMGAYVTRLENAAKNYQVALTELQTAEVLNLGTLSDKRQIASRQVVVSKFIAANRGLENIVSNSVENVRSDLAALKVSPEKAAAALKGFQSKSAVRIPLLMKIRGYDERMGQSMQNLLNLLDANWGKWKYNAEAGTVRFEDKAAQNLYKQNLVAIDEAGSEQVQIQEQLVNLQ